MATIQDYGYARKKAERNSKNFMKENILQVKQKARLPETNPKAQKNPVAGRKVGVLLGAVSRGRGGRGEKAEGRSASGDKKQQAKALLYRNQASQTEEKFEDLLAESAKNRRLEEENVKTDCEGQPTTEAAGTEKSAAAPDLKQLPLRPKSILGPPLKEKNVKGDPIKTSFPKSRLHSFRHRKDASLEDIGSSTGEAEEDGGVDVDCPYGHVLMTDADRRNHLCLVKNHYAELIKKLNNLSVSSDSLKSRQRRLQIERDLEKMEAAVRLFSRAKLYIKIDGSD